MLFTGVTTLLQKDGSAFPGIAQNRLLTPDPEALRYNPVSNNLVWSSEGDRVVNAGQSVLVNPFVNVNKLNGSYVDDFTLHSQLHMGAEEYGPRQKGVFEGFTFSGDY